MADVNVQDLSTLSPSAIDDTYYVIAFKSDGDTNKVVFEDAVGQAQSNRGCICIYEEVLNIDAADVLQLNATPQFILAAQGTDLLIDPMGITIEFKNGTTAYDTNVDLEVRIFGAAQPLFSNATILNADQECIRTMTPYDATFSTGDRQSIANSGIYIWSPTGAPATGNYDLVVRMTYRITNVS